MKKIYKYPIKLVDGDQEISMPKNAKVIAFQEQNGLLYIWAEVDPKEKNSKKLFQIVGTGHPVPEEPGMTHFGTAQAGPFVWHLYHFVMPS